MIFLKNEKRNNYLLATVVVSLLFLISCKSYKVNINNYTANNHGNVGYKFIIGSADQNISTNDLQFQEFANYTVKALTGNGFELANSTKDADLGILISYSITEPYTYTTTHSYDTYGYKAPETSNYSGNTNYYANNTYVGSGKTTGTITKQGGFGKTGTASYNKLHTLYGVRFIITAYDYKKYVKSKISVSVWTTEISMTSEINDLRDAIPVLLFKAKDNIGKNDVKKLTLNYRPTFEDPEINKYYK